jgi:hypothetical protein
VGRRRCNGWGWVEWLTATRVGLAVLVLGAVLAGGRFMTWAATKETGEADSTGRIRVGMAMSDVAHVIEPDPPPFPGGPHLSQKFPPGSRTSGWLTWRENGRVVFIHYADGRVTGVREEPAGPHGFGNYGRHIIIEDD